MNSEKIKTYCEKHPDLVSVKKTSNPDLYVLKYKNRVFYKNLWTPELLEMRGTIVDKDFNVISRPFTKIFNHTESKAPSFDPEESVVAVQKINGFMACATIYKDELLVSTTGTIDSEYAELAKKLISPYEAVLKSYSDGYSWLFEVVDRSDPHIIKEYEGLYLLNIRLKMWDAPQRNFTEKQLDEIADECGFQRPYWYDDASWKYVLDHASHVQHEGFVVYSEDKELKVKSPYYLAIKFVGRMSNKKIEDMYDNPTRFKEIIDEEFYSIVGYITRAYPINMWLSLDTQKKIECVRNYFNNIMKIKG